MLRGIKIGCWITVMFIIGGCAKSQQGVNYLIAEQNRETQMHMATSLANAKTSEAVVAMSILFAVGAGQQKFYRDDTALDYVRALSPWFNLLIPFAYGSSNNSKGGASSITAGGDVWVNSTNSQTLGTNAAWTASTYTLGGGSEHHTVTDDHSSQDNHSL